MSSRFIRGKIVYTSTYVHTIAGDVTAALLQNQSVLVVNKASGAATAVALPAANYVGQAVKVIDGKGDAATNNITITPASGTIYGAATYVISENYGSVELLWDGTNWQVSGGGKENAAQASLNATTLTATTANLTNATVSGTFLLTSIASVNAAGTVIANATALTGTVNVVAGADDAKGVVLPAAVAGQIILVYSSQATNGLKVYAPVNSSINGGTANTAIVIEGKSLALFVPTNATNYAAIFTVNA